MIAVLLNVIPFTIIYGYLYKSRRVVMDRFFSERIRMENERRDDNAPEENAPGQPSQYNQPPQGYPPQGPYPPQQGSYSNQPPQYHQQQGYYSPPQQGQWGAPPGHPQGYYVWRNLCGVGGWLLFLCIYLTIILPVLTVIAFAVSFEGVKQVIGRYPAFGNVLVVDTILSVLLVGFCIFAGCSLWAVRPYAVQIAKACLIFGMIYRVTGFVLVLTASGLPTYITTAMLPTLVVQLFIGLGILVAWLVYLCVSKRVAITYAARLNDK